MSEEYEPWEVQTFTGVGKKVVRVEPIEQHVLVMFQTGETDSNAALQGVASDGSTTWFGVNEIGQYSGTQLLIVEELPIVAFTVTCDVGWSLAVRPLSDARVWSDSQITGTSDDVLVLPDEPRGFSTIAINATVDGNTAVWAHGDEGSHLLFNFISPGEEEVVLPTDAWLVAVNSNAPWGMSRG
jgi:hypothetical protein